MADFIKTTDMLDKVIRQQIASVYPEIDLDAYVVFGRNNKDYMRPCIYVYHKRYMIVHYDLRGPNASYSFSEYEDLLFYVLDIILSGIASDYARSNKEKGVTYKELFSRQIIDLSKKFGNDICYRFIKKYSLNWARFSIGINDAKNGVLLPIKTARGEWYA